MARKGRESDQQAADAHLPPIEFQGRTYIQTDFEGCAAISDEIIRRIEKCSESIVPIGFDLEWLAYPYGTATSKTALAQLCITPRTCHLFHIYNLQKLPAAFVLLLSHRKVKLVGVNVTQDVRKLGRDFAGFPAQKVVENNCIECGILANERFETSTRWSLARLTVFLLKKKLAKPGNVRKGKWHVLPLSQAQITYAATDAYVSHIFHTKLVYSDSHTELIIRLPSKLLKNSRFHYKKRVAANIYEYTSEVCGKDELISICYKRRKDKKSLRDMAGKERAIRILWAGRMKYGPALRLQNALANLHKEQRDAKDSRTTANSLILVEHEPVYTVGIREKAYDKESEMKLRTLGADYYRTNRGGLITFHGPGQLVAYPIINLKTFDTTVRRYVCQLEKMVIRLCAEFGIKAGTTSDTGVWVNDRKICAIGVHASRYITSHGLAINCNTDLGWFDHIVPCGIEGKSVTSISQELGAKVTIEDVIPIFQNAFDDQFQCSHVEFPAAEASELLRASNQISSSTKEFNQNV